MAKKFTNNPRTITKKQYKMLQESLEKYGDLSGIVHDLNSDELISGNMRSSIIKIDECEIELTAVYETPTSQGTVAEGYVIWEGAKYNYRQVRWTEEDCKFANIAANRMGGDWDYDILANEFDPDLLIEAGFEDWEIGEFKDKGSIDDGEFSLLSLADVTLDEPKSKIERGEAVPLGNHLLVCMDVFTEHSTWYQYLTPESLLLPYAGVYALLSKKALTHRLVLIQPDPFIAAHIMDMYKSIYG